MATATRKEIKEEHVELRLSMSEAVALRTLLAFVGGDPGNPIRSALMRIDQEFNILRIYPEFLIDGEDVGPSPREGAAGVYFWNRESERKERCYS